MKSSWLHRDCMPREEWDEGQQFYIKLEKSMDAKEKRDAKRIKYLEQKVKMLEQTINDLKCMSLIQRYSDNFSQEEGTTGC